jgi:hypothetical protein
MAYRSHSGPIGRIVGDKEWWLVEMKGQKRYKLLHNPP